MQEQSIKQPLQDLQPDPGLPDLTIKKGNDAVGRHAPVAGLVGRKTDSGPHRKTRMERRKLEIHPQHNKWGQL
ncbi:hypothetical protein NDU88_007385 [Pleurodeles waltl]|uniref:Uncharacterized protein n=1 Tax=Pleurodeles waltl TaxID=8319 RepID=A0AAV7NW26_PLEWA|nr:hypothetical protein NDU88_007385 [Pleurodeles waltl]